MKILSSIRAEAQRARIIKRATLRAQWDAAGRLESLDQFERRHKWNRLMQDAVIVLLILAALVAWFPLIDLWLFT